MFGVKVYIKSINVIRHTDEDCAVDNKGTIATCFLIDTLASMGVHEWVTMDVNIHCYIFKLINICGH